MGQYLPIVLLLALAIVFVVGSLVASKLLAPRSPNDRKAAPYECGIIPSKETPERFPVRFFLIAMIFIVIDIEIIFFYPWAMAHGEVGLFGLVAVIIFTVVLFESFLYLIGNGALDWGPATRLYRVRDVIAPGRTSATTIRRVGLEGRPTDEEAA
jgi:NADH-quinone oxidoreductase subunit A